MPAKFRPPRVVSGMPAKTTRKRVRFASRGTSVRLRST